MKIKIIAVIDKNNGIGYKGKLLTCISEDLKRFKSLTTNSTIVMGRKTFQSLPKGVLPNRNNIVLTRDKNFKEPNVIVAHSIKDILEADALTEIYVIGGAEIYNQFIDIADELFMTNILFSFGNVDAYFPQIKPDKWIIKEESPIALSEYRYQFVQYIKK